MSGSARRGFADSRTAGADRPVSQAREKERTVATKHHDVWLDNCAEDEPIFVLRAQDITAPDVIEYWLSLALTRGAGIAPEKIAQAKECIREMRAWPNRKLPD